MTSNVFQFGTNKIERASTFPTNTALSFAVKRNVQYVWRVEEFAALPCRPGDPLFSPVFPATASSEQYWQLSLYPSGTAEDGTGGLSVELRLVSGERDVMEIELSILNAGGEETNKRKHVAIMSMEERSQIFREYSSRDSLLGMASDLLPEGRLTLACRIAVGGDGQVLDSSTAQAVYSPALKGARPLMETSLFSDVTLTCGDREFRVHSFLLAARSPVFLDLFEQKRGESRLELTDVRPEILQEMLHFVYEGFSYFDWSSSDCAEELFEAANRYALLRLKELCQSYMAMTMSVKNVVPRLLLADRHSADCLKTSATAFIVDHVGEVMDSVYWRKMLAYPRLISDVLRALSERVGGRAPWEGSNPWSFCSVPLIREKTGKLCRTPGLKDGSFQEMLKTKASSDARTVNEGEIMSLIKAEYPCQQKCRISRKASFGESLNIKKERDEQIEEGKSQAPPIQASLDQKTSTTADQRQLRSKEPNASHEPSEEHVHKCSDEASQIKNDPEFTNQLEENIPNEDSKLVSEAQEAIELQEQYVQNKQHHSLLSSYPLTKEQRKASREGRRYAPEGQETSIKQDQKNEKRPTATINVKTKTNAENLEGMESVHSSDPQASKNVRHVRSGAVQQAPFVNDQELSNPQGEFQKRSSALSNYRLGEDSLVKPKQLQETGTELACPPVRQYPEIRVKQLQKDQNFTQSLIDQSLVSVPVEKPQSLRETARSSSSRTVGPREPSISCHFPSDRPFPSFPEPSNSSNRLCETARSLSPSSRTVRPRELSVCRIPSVRRLPPALSTMPDFSYKYSSRPSATRRPDDLDWANYTNKLTGNTGKHRAFVSTPMQFKSVEDLPGVGAVTGGTLRAYGFNTAEDVLEKFKDLGRDRVGLVNWMTSIGCGRMYAVNCAQGLHEWCDNFL